MTTTLRSRPPKSVAAADRPDAPPPRVPRNRVHARQPDERYRDIVESSDDAIIGKTLDGVITSWNQGATRIFGYSAAYMIGQPITRIVPVELLAEEHFILQELQQGRHIRHFDTVRIAKDGRRVPVSLTVSPIHDADGTVIGASKVARDITERKLAEDAAKAAIELAREARREAERASWAKTEFLAVISHEIRTPLMSINGFADMLMRGDNLTRDQRRYVELIRTANGALRTVVDDILDFSKVEAGQFELEPRQFSLRSLVHDTLAIAHVLATERNLRLQYFVAHDVPETLVGDDARLRQILLNLLNNALKFTPRGAIEVKVSREAPIDGRETLRFSVSDTGIGIPIEQQDRLFKPFSQADRTIGRRYGGTGLGLSICKRLVELMDGDIGVVSTVGEGSTFWFTIRFVEAPASASESNRNAEPPSAGAARTRVLVVDDIDTNREIVEAYLGECGYQVDAVSSAIDAIQMLGTEAFDLVLMDIQMPVMDGVAATKRIRALPKPMRDVPILAMTGNVLPMQIKAFLDAGMNGHVAKPISRAKLHESVRRWEKPSGASPTEPSSDAAPVDGGELHELIDALGAERAVRIARAFARDLSAAFRADGALDEARREAHALINCAGILGLSRFVRACRTIEYLPLGDPEFERAALAQIRAERSLARETLLGQLLPMLQDRLFRPTG